MFSSEKHWWLLNLGVSVFMLFVFYFISLQDNELSQPEIAKEEISQKRRLPKLSSRVLPSPPNITAQNKAVATPPNVQKTKTELNRDDLGEVDLSINLPGDSRMRERIGRYLYQCVGIGFGVLKQSQGDYELTVLKESQYSASQILRRVEQNFYVNEKHWQRSVGDTGEFVRVYPRWLDDKLVSLIEQNMHSDSLSSFTASYQLNNRKLQLIDIYINDTAVNQVWTLAQAGDLLC